MTFFLAAAFLLGVPSQEHIYFVGSHLTMQERISLQQALGPGIRINFVGFKDAPKRSEANRVIVSMWPDVRTSKWKNGLDQFVPATRSLLSDIARRFPNATHDVLLGIPTLAEERARLRPLLSQASREAGWRTLDLNYSGVSGPAWRKLYALIAPIQYNPGSWRVLEATSEETDEGPATYAIDGKPETYWHTRWSSNPTKVPHELVVDLGSQQQITGFSYLARQDGGVNGRVKKFEIYVSRDPRNWAQPAMQGELANTTIEQRLLFVKPVEGRYLRFRALSEVNGNPWTTCAELGILQ